MSFAAISCSASLKNDSIYRAMLALFPHTKVPMAVRRKEFASTDEKSKRDKNMGYGYAVAIAFSNFRDGLGSSQMACSSVKILSSTFPLFKMGHTQVPCPTWLNLERTYQRWQA
jgi:hypothetical protein